MKPLRLGTAIAVVGLALAGCGSGAERAAPPAARLPAQLAGRLASQSDTVARLLARNDGCGALAAAQRLQEETTSAINAGRVPTRFQEPLAAAANDLVFRIHCAPKATVSPPTVTAPTVSTPEDEHGKQHGRGKRHGKGHGKGHGKAKHGRGGEGD